MHTCCNLRLVISAESKSVGMVWVVVYRVLYNTSTFHNFYNIYPCNMSIGNTYLYHTEAHNLRLKAFRPNEMSPKRVLQEIPKTYITWGSVDNAPLDR